VCLIGLFVLNMAIGPMVCIACLLGVTVLTHFTLTDALAPLISNLPQTLTVEEDIREEEKALATASSSFDSTHADTSGAAAYYDTEIAFGDEHEHDHDEHTDGDETDETHQVTGSRGVEGLPGTASAFSSLVKSLFHSKLQSEAASSGLTNAINKLSAPFSASNSNTPPTILSRWLHPEIYDDFIALRALLTNDDMAPEDEEPFQEYLPPELWLGKPTLWIPRDEAHVSRQEVAHSKGVLPVTDAGSRLTGKGRVAVDMARAPFDEPRMQL
jgi:hypothetical protein